MNDITFDTTPVLNKEYIWTGNIKVKVVDIETKKLPEIHHKDGSYTPTRNDVRVTLEYTDPQYKYCGTTIRTRWTKYSFEPTHNEH